MHAWFLESSEPPLPPPSSIEVSSSEVPSSVKYTMEPINLDDLVLLKRRVSTKEIIGLPNSDLVSGFYEGGFKLWKGSIVLAKALCSEVQNDQLSLKEKRVIELGCDHGFSGIIVHDSPTRICTHDRKEAVFQRVGGTRQISLYTLVAKAANGSSNARKV
ncbi:hypothetical protein V6N13_083198 [Hibiscus sabdariffa]